MLSAFDGFAPHGESSSVLNLAEGVLQYSKPAPRCEGLALLGLVGGFHFKPAKVRRLLAGDPRAQFNTQSLQRIGFRY